VLRRRRDAGIRTLENDFMTNRTRILPLFAAALLVGACSEASTDVIEPQFAKGGGGNAHFQMDGTSCDVDGTDISCVYKIVGLGKNENVTVKLTGAMTVTYNCVNNGNQSPPPWQGLEQTASDTDQESSGKNGMITGSLSISASGPPANEACPSHTWTVDPVSSSMTAWSLSATGKFGTITL
jgi:hypothetical protein